jgi:outer membrane protein assembly factor BamB
MKKPLVVLFAVLGAAALSAQTHTLVKLWETEATLKVPESVLYDAGRGVLFITNVDGEPWADDGKGSIGKVGLDGKVIATDWVTGLSAPKGMGLRGNKLYAADIDRVVVIDVEKGEIVDKIAVDGAHGLNDIALGADGTIYVSDSKDKKIYAIRDGKAMLVIEGLRAPNGVHLHDGQLHFADRGSLYRLDSNNDKVLVSVGKEGNGDGVESVGSDEFLVSYWPGVIDYVKADGSREVVLDTTAAKVNAADLGYDPVRRIVYVPTFFKNSVVAYELK